MRVRAPRFRGPKALAVALGVGLATVLASSVASTLEGAHATVLLPVAPHPSDWLVQWRELPEPAGGRPRTLLVASTGVVWFDDESTGTLNSYDPVSGTWAVVPTTATSPWRVSLLVESSDGAIWFADPSDSVLHRYDPASAAVSDLALPGADRITDLTAARDGSVWFGTATASVVGHARPDGSIDLVTITGGSGGIPESVTWGQDGRLWMTQFGSLTVDALDPGTGTVTSLPLSSRWASHLESGADGALWMLDGSDLLRLDPAGTEDRFPVPTTPAGLALPTVLRPGSQGVIYADTTGRIVSVDPRGRFTVLGPSTPGLLLGSIDVAPDGSIWFTDPLSGRLGWG
ncbi:hypothetical protein GCM10010988_33790 [Cnuibacter physcomitrellae]|uniref:Uncharacterized protein n=1 Tax=Cnuibacter physcomitrellae TaxID=1619308 RepID=A0A1X9LH82_9MICO|nr:hypothetical protein [Cnuibacter physcomitrellae]ARJ04576.1 hypothetical protein B5808_04565 [Cnuibacter physcomitrellae]GGI41376.1 hypothetical protein GCM10010988_33790 [Cnuibacter physcomitrellae]